MFYIKIAFTVVFAMWFYDGLKKAAAERREMKEFNRRMGFKNNWSDEWFSS